MAKPTLYKKTPNNNLIDRQITSANPDEDTRMSTVIHKFFELFRDKHLG